MKRRITAGHHSAPSLRERIQRAREALGLSRAQLARKVGVSASAAVQWERPHGTLPSAANLIAIAKITDVSFEWLSTGRGMPRLHGDHETPAISRECMAHDLFEERVLLLARKLPHTHRDAFLQYFEKVYS
jgi:transcriptional regulator with XRE-family HTH domain